VKKYLNEESLVGTIIIFRNHRSLVSSDSLHNLDAAN